jgi:type VI protein secretion system component Hcp
MDFFRRGARFQFWQPTKKGSAMRALYQTIIAVTVLTVAASGQALAGGKGGGGGGGGGSRASGEGPKANTSLNYGKIEQTYKPQKDDGSLSANKTGKVRSNEFTIKKTSDKASP